MSASDELKQKSNGEFGGFIDDPQLIAKYQNQVVQRQITNPDSPIVPRWNISDSDIQKAAAEPAEADPHTKAQGELVRATGPYHDTISETLDRDKKLTKNWESHQFSRNQSKETADYQAAKIKEIYPQFQTRVKQTAKGHTVEWKKSPKQLAKSLNDMVSDLQKAPMYSKRHYIDMANHLAQQGANNNSIKEWSDKFAADNPRFDPNRFAAHVAKNRPMTKSLKELTKSLIDIVEKARPSRNSGDFQNRVTDLNRRYQRERGRTGAEGALAVKRNYDLGDSEAAGEIERQGSKLQDQKIAYNRLIGKIPKPVKKAVIPAIGAIGAAGGGSANIGEISTPGLGPMGMGPGFKIKNVGANIGGNKKMKKEWWVGKPGFEEHHQKVEAERAAARKKALTPTMTPAEEKARERNFAALGANWRPLKKSRPYVGHKGETSEVFHWKTTPTQDSHGHKYDYVTGPFNSSKGASIMARYGRNNPHLQTTTDADRMASKHPEMLKSLDQLINTLEKSATLETNMIKCNPFKEKAALNVKKCIQLLKGYEPLTDDEVKKSFHGVIPELMKEVTERPSAEWWSEAIAKAEAFEDPVMEAMDIWYKGNKGILGAGIGGLAGGALAGPVGAAGGAMAGTAIGSEMDKKETSAPVTNMKKEDPAVNIPHQSEKVALNRQLAEGKIDQSRYDKVMDLLEKGGTRKGSIAANHKAGAYHYSGPPHLAGEGPYDESWATVSLPDQAKKQIEEHNKNWGAPSPFEKGVLGAGLGGLAGGALGGPVGAAAGAMGGSTLEDTLKPKAVKAQKSGDVAKSVLVIKEMIDKLGDEELAKEWQIVENSLLIEKAVAEPIGSKKVHVPGVVKEKDFGGQSNVANPTIAETSTLNEKSKKNTSY